MYLVRRKINTVYAPCVYCNSFKDALDISDKAFKDGFADIIVEPYTSGGKIDIYVDGKKVYKQK